MKPKRKETEKNNRREALSAIILSPYTVHLVGSEPTTCTLVHTTIYYRMPFIESCDELQHHTFISDDPAVTCTICTSISSVPAAACTVSYSFLWILRLHTPSYTHFVGPCICMYRHTFISSNSAAFCTILCIYLLCRQRNCITIPFQTASHSPTQSAARHLRKPLLSLPDQKTRYPCHFRNNRSPPFLRPYKPLPSYRRKTVR